MFPGKVTYLTRLLNCVGENWTTIASEFWQESESMTMPTAIKAERTKSKTTREICRNEAMAIPQLQLTTLTNISRINKKSAAANAPIAT